MENINYFICCDNGEEKARLYDELSARGYHFDHVTREWLWKDSAEYHYIPLLVNIEMKTVTAVPIFGAAVMCSQGKRFYTPDEFLLQMQNSTMEIPRILFHIPHDGHEFPKELMKGICIPEERFRFYHETMRDTHVFQMVPGAYRHEPFVIKFPVSRLLCDVERFIGSEEVMEKYGMGFCYSHAYDGKQIKNVTEALKRKVLKYYRKHHQKLNEMMCLSSQVFLIDLHSYSDEIVPVKFITSKELPDICIGTDSVYTPKYLEESARSRFSNAGYSVAENYPYAGCMVPNIALKSKSKNLLAGIMIEVNKRVYLDQDGRVIEEEAGKIRQILKDLAWEYEQTTFDCREKA